MPAGGTLFISPASGETRKGVTLLPIERVELRHHPDQSKCQGLVCEQHSLSLNRPPGALGPSIASVHGAFWSLQAMNMTPVERVRPGAGT